MQVVLTKDVKGTGKANAVVSVKDGFALNYLIARKLAVPASAAALKQAELRAKQAAAKGELDAKLIGERLVALAEEKLVFVKKANEQNHLYDAVDAKEIAEKAGIPVDAVRIEKPFKELGTFEVPVAFGEQFGKLTIVVEAE
jgi:large subunit ribosomal protein L9